MVALQLRGAPPGLAAVQPAMALGLPGRGQPSRQSRGRLAVRADGDGGYDLIATPRIRVQQSAAPAKPPANDFMSKVKAAWRIFFPPKPEQLSPKEAGKSRLRMILVADRCGMNQASMYEMRHSIVRAVSNFVEIEAEDLVEVNVTSEPEMGTVYSVAVPVRRVKPQARGVLAGAEEALEADGITLSWDADDKQSDPSDRFPFGC